MGRFSVWGRISTTKESVLLAPSCFACFRCGVIVSVTYVRPGFVACSANRVVRLKAARRTCYGMTCEADMERERMFTLHARRGIAADLRFSVPFAGLHRATTVTGT